MKAISLWQPHASLWCSDDKEHETRHWSTSYRGWLLVHAAKKLVKDFGGDPIESITTYRFGPNWRTELPTGAIVGAVEITGCKRTEDLLKEWGCPPEPIRSRYWIDYQCGNYGPGRYAWVRDDYKMFKSPIPYRGAQGFFNVPDELVREAMGL